MISSLWRLSSTSTPRARRENSAVAAAPVAAMVGVWERVAATGQAATAARVAPVETYTIATPLVARLMSRAILGPWAPAGHSARTAPMAGRALRGLAEREVSITRVASVFLVRAALGEVVARVVIQPGLEDFSVLAG